MPLSEKDRRIAYGILKHLRSQLDKGVVEGDPSESVEVAIQCLSEAYGVDLSSASHSTKYDIKPTLEELFSRAGPADESVKEKAEAFKHQGNTHLKLNKFKEAVESYGKAIDLDPTNATYFCNRAAAYIKLQELQKALEDCKQAVSLNPSYARAFGRMGYVYTSLNKLEESKDCFKKAIELDPDNENYKTNLDTVEEQLRGSAAPGGASAAGASQGAQPQPQPQQQPGAGLAGMLGGANLAGLMSNPGFMNMASSMMSNPAFQEMTARMMGSGGLQGDNLAGMIPNVMQMAQQMQQNNPEMFDAMRQQAASMAASQQQPGSQQPGSQQPGSQQSGSQQPGSQQPGSQQPGSQQPGSQQPGSQQSGQSQSKNPDGGSSV